MARNYRLTFRLNVTCGRKFVRRFYRFQEANNFPRAEQIMFKDKYPSLFSCQMEPIVFVILQIFFARRAGLKIGDYHSDIPQFYLILSQDAFRPIARERKYLMDYNFNNYLPQWRWLAAKRLGKYPLWAPI